MDEAESAAIFRLLGNPIRIGFLRAMRGRPALSPVEYARESGRELREVSRQVRALAGAGVIVVVEVIPRRGAFEHRYAPRGRMGDATLALIAVLDLV